MAEQNAGAVLREAETGTPIGTVANPLVTSGGGGGAGDASAANQTTLNTLTGAVTEAAPASDTASSGLNGRLQRLAQRVTSLIALIPTSLGAKTSAASFAVVLASDQAAIPVTGAGGGTQYTEGGAADTTLTGTVLMVEGAGDLPVPAQGTVTDGLLVNLGTNNDVSLGVSEDHIGSVGSNTARIYVNPVVTAGAYAAGDVVGPETTLTNFMRITGGSARAMGITLVDVANIKPALDFLLFDQAPTAAIADNGAYAWNAADYAKLVMYFRVDAAEWTTVGTAAVCSKALSAFGLVASGSANLYLYIVTPNIITFAAATDLHLMFYPDRD